MSNIGTEEAVVSAQQTSPEQMSEEETINPGHHFKKLVSILLKLPDFSKKEASP